MARFGQEEKRDHAVDEQSQGAGLSEGGEAHITRPGQGGKSRRRRGAAEKDDDSQFALGGDGVAPVSFEGKEQENAVIGARSEQEKYRRQIEKAPLHPKETHGPGKTKKNECRCECEEEHGAKAPQSE